MRFDLLKMMLKMDLAKRFGSSSFALFWYICEPLFVTFLFVFGMRQFSSNFENNNEYLAYFLSGYGVFYSLQNVVGSSLNVFLEYKSFIKNFKFPFEVLPKIKAVLAFFISLIFISVACVLSKNQIHFEILSCFLVLYFVFIMLLGQLVAYLSVTMIDFKQTIVLAMQILFFATPLFWKAEMVSVRWLFVLKWNPVFYLVDGVRSGLGFTSHYTQLDHYLFLVFLILMLLILRFVKIKARFIVVENL